MDFTLMDFTLMYRFLIVLVLFSGAIATQERTVLVQMYKEGEDFTLSTSGCDAKCNDSNVTLRSLRFGVYITPTSREPCWITALDKPAERGKHKICSKLKNRIGSLKNCFLKDGCGGIFLKNLMPTDNGDYYLHVEDSCHCTKKYVIKLNVSTAKDVATNETITTAPSIATTPGTVSTPGIVTTPAAKPVAKSNCLTHEPVMLLLSILMFVVAL